MLFLRCFSSWKDEGTRTSNGTLWMGWMHMSAYRTCKKPEEVIFKAWVLLKGLVEDTAFKRGMKLQEEEKSEVLQKGEARNKMTAEVPTSIQLFTLVLYVGNRRSGWKAEDHTGKANNRLQSQDTVVHMALLHVGTALHPGQSEMPHGHCSAPKPA